MKKIYLVGSIPIIFLLLSPMFIYGWGLSNLASKPVPSTVHLSYEKQKNIWFHVGEVGEPSIKPVTPYGYIGYLKCYNDNLAAIEVCSKKYPGLRIAYLSVKDQVLDKIVDRRALYWHITGAAYAVWVTRNWNVQQVISTYNESNT